MMTQNWAVRMTEDGLIGVVLYQQEFTPESAEALAYAITHWAKQAKAERAKETGESRSMKTEKIVVAMKDKDDGYWRAYRVGSEALKKFMADEFNEDWDICTVDVQE